MQKLGYLFRGASQAEAYNYYNVLLLKAYTKLRDCLFRLMPVTG